MGSNDKPHLFKKGQKARNAGTGGCKVGHDPSLYKKLPNGVYVCLGCKRENAKKYRRKDIKRYNLKNRVKRYGINIDDYNEMREKQNGCCAICKSQIVLETSRIDHNHVTGRVRGLLCVSCNTGIGLLKDSPQIMKNAISYLRGNE